MKKRTTMMCDDVLKTLCDTLDENVNSPHCRAIRKHLGECEHCKSFLDGVKMTIELYQRYTPPPLAKKSHHRILKTIKNSA
jgi:predicted anti-sigma-YlaC factor YlaD